MNHRMGMSSIRSSRSASAALLIQSIVRQTATLLTQLSTAAERRPPLAHITSQVYFDLAQELERLGVTRQVSADMFGLGAYAHRRSLTRSSQSLDGLHGPSLRDEVLSYIRSGQIVPRTDVFLHFSDADESQIRAILRELREHGLLFALGKGTNTAYRATTPAEVAALNRKYDGESSAILDAIDGSNADPLAPILVNAAGEGTYAVAVWEGHPLEQEALDILRQLRKMLTELRERVVDVEREPTVPPPADSVVVRLAQADAKSV